MLAMRMTQCSRLVRPLNLSRASRVPLAAPVRASSSEAAPDYASAAASIKLYCGNLSWDTQRDDLEDLFSKFGQVSDAFVASDRETGRSRGFGFVTMDQAGGKDAIAELNETDFMGRTIRVNEAQAREERPPRSFGGRGGGRGGGFRGGRGGSYGGGNTYGDRRGGGRGGFRSQNTYDGGY